jgi:branched-chain amino acid transport system ATP-binding protein
MTATPLLEINNLNAFYGKSLILNGVSLHVNQHERVFIFGRNGVGKTTLLRSILGIDSVIRSGEILWEGENVIEKPPYYVAQKGIGYVPQGRRLFSSLSVDEHLRFAYRPNGHDKKQHRWTPASVYQLFPELVKRRRVSGTKLSGGEQQMLAIGRSLVTNPILLTMDEPTEGLAPIVAQRVMEICVQLADTGMSLLITAPDLLMSQIAQRVYIIAKGEIAYKAAGKDFLMDEEAQRMYLGV